MISVFDGSMVVHEFEPRDTTVVVLKKLSIGFKALIIVHDKLW